MTLLILTVIFTAAFARETYNEGPDTRLVYIEPHASADVPVYVPKSQEPSYPAEPLHSRPHHRLAPHREQAVFIAPQKLEELSAHRPRFTERPDYKPRPSYRRPHPAPVHEPEPYRPEPEPYRPEPVHRQPVHREPYRSPRPTYHETAVAAYEPEPYRPEPIHRKPVYVPEPVHRRPEPYHPEPVHRKPEPAYHRPAPHRPKYQRPAPKPYHLAPEHPKPAYTPEPEYKPAPKPHRRPVHRQPVHVPEPHRAAPTHIKPYVAPRRPQAIQHDQAPYEEYHDDPFKNIPGVPGTDFPVYAVAPYTGFSCDAVPVRPGMYADPEAGCQAYYVCEEDGRQHDFLCTNGTVFNQLEFSCDWWYNVPHCHESVSLYSLNADPLKNPYYKDAYKEEKVYAEPHVAAPHRAAPHVAAPHRAAPHRAAPHRVAPHRAAPHRAAPHRVAPHRAAPHVAAPHVAAPHRAAPHRRIVYSGSY